jgi:hypothetical protein
LLAEKKKKERTRIINKKKDAAKKIYPGLVIKAGTISLPKHSRFY